MEWHKLLSPIRFGMEQYHNDSSDGRSEFQRDYDRLIFSSPFRRLQNKTQVFPLPGSVFVHNRLTHSLEVSCVGRSIANEVAFQLHKKHAHLPKNSDEIGSIVAAACLAHDLGNPPFGHSGENAIATYFSEEKGAKFKSQLPAEEWTDFIRFEGNANAFRLLTHQFNGRREGGFALTYSTLASIVKYPYESQYADSSKTKFGFFQTEKSSFERIANELGIIRHPEFPNRYARHPLVYLVEAADDICYQIMDIEDAFKLRILTFDETQTLLLAFLPEKRKERALNEIFKMVTDTNEQIAYLRSTVIGILIKACATIFVENEEDMLAGKFQKSLIHKLPEPLQSAYTNCSQVAVAKIYKSQEVLDVELAGYRIISELLETLIEAVSNPTKAYSKQILNRIPSQYDIHSELLYNRIQAVLDYISGMTDVYALDLYRKINGMSLPEL
ncbi:MAG TPA: deoxyguanosinetriphosphate triphosphohydrolase [Paludibacteraceae bacterium]|nr:deoxyguanosinetriphosphate triphosphohydrolase [Paludibacteraceae bacterium]